MDLKSTPQFGSLKRRVRDLGRRVVGWHEVFSHESVRSFQAVLEGADYADEHMKGAFVSVSRREVLLHSLERASKEGSVLEFGVWNGETINLIADRVGPSRTVHGFDSFEGLPEDWFGMYRKGAFDTAGKLPRVRSNVALHKGWFADTLPTFVKNHNERIAFLHVDCDLYSSAKTIFEFLAETIVPGTVILFDEYFNYPGWREHEYKAFQEFVASRSLQYRYLAYNTSYCNASVQIV